MSLAELDINSLGGPARSSYGSADDRLPPQDVHAEQSVIGGMLLSKDAIADCVEGLKGADFYRPAHELIYDAILDLYSRGEPADAITVSDELTKRGDLTRVGGQAYLHQLISEVPTAANAGYYAEIVAERAVLRRLVDAGTRIVQMGYGQGGGDVVDIVNAAQAEIYAVADKRGGDDYAVLGDVLEATVDEIEHASGRSGEMTGVPTGFTDFDALTNGLHPGQMIVVAARPAVGKALALGTALPTPTGWTTMGEVAVGDLVIGGDGRPTTVARATEVMTGRPCFEVEFSDGSVIVADAEHQWLTDTQASRMSAQAARDQSNRTSSQRTLAGVRTTAQIAATLRCDTTDKRLNHSVPLAPALDLSERSYLLPPYVLGAWLGAGTTASAQITTADPELMMRLEGQELLVPPPEALRAVGVLNDKHIPGDYLRGSQRQRRDLLAGLLDADGAVTADGCAQLTTTSDRLSRDVCELVVSLGYRCAVSRKRVRGHSEKSSVPFTLTFSTDDDVFALERKRLLHKKRRGRTLLQRMNSRLITAVRAVESVPVRCIEVDSQEHLYLAGESMIPTHNSTWGLDIARSAAIRHKMATVLFSLEMSRTEITMRLLSAEASIQLQNMRKGTMRDEDWTRLARTMGEVSDAPLFIDDSPNMSLMEIRAKCRRLKQRHNLRLVIIDYLQLMSSGKRVESRQQEVSEFSRALKLLAKELEVPVIAISQLNRGSEQRTDKRPQMSDLRESGCLTADTRILRADTGAETSMGELYAEGATDVPVWSLDDSLRCVKRHLTHVFPTGVKPVFRLTLASGKTIRATENHPFLAYDGWTQLADLRTGSRVAVPRHVPAPQQRDDHDGVSEIAQLDDSVSGMALAAGPAAFVPAAVFHLPKRRIGIFLKHLWAMDGSVRQPRAGEDGRIRLTSLSRRLLDDVSRLLLRFGISCRISPAGNGFTLDVSGVDDQRRFLREIDVYGERSAEGMALLDLVLVRSGDRSRSRRAEATAPTWGRVGEVMATAAFCPANAGAVDAVGMGQVVQVLDEADLDLEAVNDVLWDSVVSIESDGVEEVFDATVLGTHNFIANGIAVHNSIEQDADMVILLHRESMYERESPREGEADLIVAKHRNGPTDTITVAFQGHYSRFTNMATNF